jgi:ankyrin repeat protein
MFKLLVERYFLTPNDEYEAKEKMKLLTYPDGNGLTPLMILSKYGDRRYACEYAEKLIHIYKDKDRNHKYVEIINAKGPNGWYPVHFAANNPRATEVLELLLRNGAWAEARTDGNEAKLFESNLTPLHIACHIFPPEGEKPPNFEHAAYDNVKCILQVSCPPRPKGHNTSRDVPDRTNFVNTLYPTQRAENKKEYTKKKLIGWTPLHRLAKCPVVMRKVSSDRRAASSPRSPRMERDRTKLEVCRLLIEFDATVNIGTDDGETVLHLAILQNDCDFCKVICDDACYKNDNAPNVDIPDRHGDAPVHLAVKYGAKYGNIDILKFLITPTHTRQAVDLKNGDNNGDTPLHLAINEMDLEMVELLVDAGAKVNFKNSEKKDAKKLTEDFIADLITDGDPDPNHLVTYRRISKVLTGGKKS